MRVGLVFLGFQGCAGIPSFKIFLEKLGYSGYYISMVLEGHLPSLGATRQFFASFAHSFRYTGICKKSRVFGLKPSVWLGLKRRVEPH